jgi:HEAT repeat protein
MKRFILFIILSFTGMALFAQSEELAMWSDEFDRAGTVAEQLIFVQNVEQGNYAGAEEFYAKALHRLIEEYPNISTQSEWNAADACARILAPKLGDAGYSAAAPDLWQLVDSFSNALVKSDALIALGKVDTGKAFLPQVVQLVKDWNTRPQSDRESRERVERIVHGAVIALENYKDPSGYLPVFFVSTGWYADRVKRQASVSLPAIMDDPTDPLLEVVGSPGYTYDIKHLALRTSERSSSPDEKKASVAVAALAEGWKASTNVPLQQRELAAMRKLALTVIRRCGTQDSSVYANIDKSYGRMGVDRQERLYAIDALKALASDESVRLLSAYLRDLTERQRSGAFTNEDGVTARAVIPALGDIGKAAARTELLRVQQLPVWAASNYRALATQALQKLQ